MKRTVLAMVWIAIGMAAMQTAGAQTNPKRGYVITNENDTIHGTIDYRTNARNAIQCDFLADGATDIRLGRHIGRIACNYQWFSNHQAGVNTHAVTLSLGLLF